MTSEPKPTWDMDSISRSVLLGDASTLSTPSIPQAVMEASSTLKAVTAVRPQVRMGLRGWIGACLFFGGTVFGGTVFGMIAYKDEIAVLTGQRRLSTLIVSTVGQDIESRTGNINPFLVLTPPNSEFVMAFTATSEQVSDEHASIVSKALLSVQFNNALAMMAFNDAVAMMALTSDMLTEKAVRDVQRLAYFWTFSPGIKDVRISRLGTNKPPTWVVGTQDMLVPIMMTVNGSQPRMATLRIGVSQVKGKDGLWKARISSVIEHERLWDFSNFSIE